MPFILISSAPHKNCFGIHVGRSSVCVGDKAFGAYLEEGGDSIMVSMRDSNEFMLKYGLSGAGAAKDAAIFTA